MSRIQKLIGVAKSSGRKTRATFYVSSLTIEKFRAICDVLNLEYSHALEAILDDFIDTQLRTVKPDPTRCAERCKEAWAVAEETPSRREEMQQIADMLSGWGAEKKDEAA